MRRRVLAALFLSCGLWGDLASAQLWRGAAALEVQVDDPSGKPAAGAKVTLLFQAVEPKAGPPVVTTDAQGRALFFGLADGWWAVAVRREGALTFHAELVLSGEKKPAVLSTFQENAPNAKETLKVRVGRPRPGDNPPRGEVKEIKPAAPPPPAASAPPVDSRTPISSEKKEAPVASPPAASAPPVAPQAPISSEKKEAPVASPPPAASAPPVDSQKPISSEKGSSVAPTPTAPPPPPPAAQALPPAAVPPSSPPTQQTAPPASQAPPPAAVPPSSPPTQQTAPPTPQAPPPAMAPPSSPPTQQTAPPTPQAPPPAPPPPVSVLRRSYSDRTCFECKPGESSLTVEAIAPAGGTGCGPEVATLISPSAFSAASTPPVGCALLKIELPAGARFTGYRYEVEEGGRAKDCLAGKDCPQGNCAWPLDPATKRKGGVTTLTAAFENRSPAAERRARFTVYFAAAEP